MLKNYMEEMVDIYLPFVIAEYKDTCKCDKCILDIKAITLNHLQPLYIVTKQGEVFSKINELGMQFRVNIIEELTKAMDIVSKSPRHAI